MTRRFDSFGYRVGIALCVAACTVVSGAAAEDTTALDRPAIASAASRTDNAAQGLLDSLNVAAIPLHTRTRIEFMSDFLSNAEDIQHASRTLIRKMEGDISDRHVQKRVERIALNFRDLERNKEWLIVPDPVDRKVAILGSTVRELQGATGTTGD